MLRPNHSMFPCPTRILATQWSALSDKSLSCAQFAALLRGHRISARSQHLTQACCRNVAASATIGRLRAGHHRRAAAFPAAIQTIVCHIADCQRMNSAVSRSHLSWLCKWWRLYSIFLKIILRLRRRQDIKTLCVVRSRVVRSLPRSHAGQVQLIFFARRPCRQATRSGRSAMPGLSARSSFQVAVI